MRPTWCAKERPQAQRKGTKSPEVRIGEEGAASQERWRAEERTKGRRRRRGVSGEVRVVKEAR